MSTDALTLFNPEMLAHLEKMAGTLSKSSLIPEALRNKPGDVLVTLMCGAELGLQPMQALRSIAVVKGKPALSADLMVSLVKQRKDVCEYLVLVKSTPEVATYRAKRIGEPEPTEMSFTMQDAQRAGLTGQGGMYSKYPAQMLRARCASGICRAVFPDLCMGLYDSDSGELTEGKPTAERDVTPKRGLEAIPSAAPEKMSKPSEATVEAPKPEAPALPSGTKVHRYGRKTLDRLTVVELQDGIKKTREWLTKNKESPFMAETEERLAAMMAEEAGRHMVEAGTGEAPPGEAEESVPF